MTNETDVEAIEQALMSRDIHADIMERWYRLKSHLATHHQLDQMKVRAEELELEAIERQAQVQVLTQQLETAEAQTALAQEQLAELQQLIDGAIRKTIIEALKKEMKG
jgi:hypothetical protein